RVILFFCPILASSWNQISIGLPGASRVAICATVAAKFYGMARPLLGRQDAAFDRMEETEHDNRDARLGPRQELGSHGGLGCGRTDRLASSRQKGPAIGGDGRSAALPDRHGSVLRSPPSGPGAGGARSHGAADAAPVCQALRQGEQARSSGWRSRWRGGLATRH